MSRSGPLAMIRTLSDTALAGAIRQLSASAYPGIWSSVRLAALETELYRRGARRRGKAGTW